MNASSTGSGRLETAPHRPVADPEASDVQLAGLGIDWETVPAVLDDAGLTEWQRLGEVFAKDPVRFREGDRAALPAYCCFWSAFVLAADEVRVMARWLRAARIRIVAER